jgi:hypothetical protein
MHFAPIDSRPTPTARPATDGLNLPLIYSSLAALLMLTGCGDGAATTDPDTGVGVCTAHANCDDDTFCNGAERCSPGASDADARGCVAGTGSTCLAIQACNEATDECETSCETGADADGDGFDAVSCGGDDCNDSDALTFTGNTEVCDAGHDEDCDPTTFGPDVDGDGFASAECCNGDACGEDCDDTSDTVGPSGTEACNLVDDDCDGSVDDGVQSSCFLDADGDSYATVGAVPMMACTCGNGFTATAPSSAADCNDANVTINPAVPEVCNAVDDNCNGVNNEGVSTTYYRDLDGDGQGAATSGTLQACSLPATGYTVDNTDCNDTCGTCRVGAPEVCDGNDNDCNGMTDENIGAVCTSGVGACMRTGTTRCNGTCTAVAGTPSSVFQTSVAPNGSWDWNCDGVTTPQTVVTHQTAATALEYCQAQVCSAGTAGEFRPPNEQAGFVTRLGQSPHCGSPLWLLIEGNGTPIGCVRNPNTTTSGLCTQVRYSGHVSSTTQACR